MMSRQLRFAAVVAFAFASTACGGIGDSVLAPSQSAISTSIGHGGTMAQTDPIGNAGWFDNVNGEIGDI